MDGFVQSINRGYPTKRAVGLEVPYATPKAQSRVAMNQSEGYQESYSPSQNQPALTANAAASSHKEAIFSKGQALMHAAI